MTGTKMALLPKGEVDFKGIGFVEVIRKLFTSIMKNRLRTSITLLDSLHGLRQGWGTGTATLETNLVQQLAGICHARLFWVLLDVHKVYDLIYQKIFMEVLKGYGIGTKIMRLIQQFWGNQEIVPKAGRFYGPTVQDSESSDPGVSSITYIIWHHGWSSCKGIFYRGMRPVWCTAWAKVVFRWTQHYDICRKLPYCGQKPHMGAKDTDGAHTHVWYVWPA